MGIKTEIRLRRHSYIIRARKTFPDGGFGLETSFRISGKPVDSEQAMQIAKILEPMIEFDSVEIENDYK